MAHGAFVDKLISMSGCLLLVKGAMKKWNDLYLEETSIKEGDLLIFEPNITAMAL